MSRIPVIAIDVNLGFFQKWFGGMRSRAVDLTPVLSTAVDSIVTGFLKRQFDSQGAEGGNSWAEWAESTREARTRKGNAGQGIGRDTLRLWSSLVQNPAMEGMLIIDQTSYTRWSTVPYAGFFHAGRKGQPARPIIPNPLPFDLTEQIRNTIAYYVKTGRSEVNAPDTNVDVSVNVVDV